MWPKSVHDDLITRFAHGSSCSVASANDEKPRHNHQQIGRQLDYPSAWFTILVKRGGFADESGLGAARKIFSRLERSGRFPSRSCFSLLLDGRTGMRPQNCLATLLVSRNA